MDENILSIIKEKKEEWFQGQNIEDAFLDVGQTHSIKLMKDSSKIKLRVPKDTIAYNSKKEQIELNGVPIDSEVTCILQLVGMWFTKTRWGVTWKTVQVKTHEKKKEPLRVYMFADEEVEDDEEILYPPPGSLVCALIAYGYTPDELIKLMYKHDIINKRDIDITMIFENFGIDNGKTFKEFLIRCLKDITFQDLYVKNGNVLIITAYNIDRMQTEYFNKQTTPNMLIVDA
eukprot:gene25122-30659_t